MGDEVQRDFRGLGGSTHQGPVPCLSHTAYACAAQGNPRTAAVNKTLIDSFRYPRRGPGKMWHWSRAANIFQMGGKINMGEEATGIAYDSSAKAWTVSTRDLSGEARFYKADYVISTSP